MAFGPTFGRHSVRAGRAAWLTFLAMLLLAGRSAAAPLPPLPDIWPDPAALKNIQGTTVPIPSTSPAVPNDIGDTEAAPQVTVKGELFMPPGAHPDHSVPAVVLLHGAMGILAEREPVYARSLAAMGVAALVVDSFRSRDVYTKPLLERLLEVTETALVADAYAGLHYLAMLPAIDGKRVVLIGFSYGGMAATYALYANTAARLGSPGLRFAGHVAYYAPCIVRFADHRTTGAPILMVQGADDELIDPRRCREIAEDMRAGGSVVETATYPGAVHQWDGPFPHRLYGYNLKDCALTVEPDGTVRDQHTGLAMSGSFSRKIIFLLCGSRHPIPIERNDTVRARSNRDLSHFLNRVFGPTAATR